MFIICQSDSYRWIAWPGFVVGIDGLGTNVSSSREQGLAFSAPQAVNVRTLRSYFTRFSVCSPFVFAHTTLFGMQNNEGISCVAPDIGCVQC